jgi:hypothetical protein
MDNGWGEEHQLNRTDAFIKNTYEVTSWVARLAANSPMTDHRFLNETRDAEATIFKDDMGKTIGIIINQNEQPVNVKADGVFDDVVVLGKYDFFVNSPTFMAIHAKTIGNRTEAAPFLFTFRSLDGKPLAESKKIRVFHGFGSSKIKFFGKDIDVRSEAIIER